MTGVEERERLQKNIAWHNTMMIEAAWKDQMYLENIHRAEIERLEQDIFRLDNLCWVSINFQTEVEGVPV